MTSRLSTTRFASVALLLVTSSARAAIPPPHSDCDTIPVLPAVGDAPTTIPRNAPAIGAYIVNSNAGAGLPPTILRGVGDGATDPVTSTSAPAADGNVVIRSSQLAVGQDYTIVFPGRCSQSGRPLTQAFRVVDAVPLPTQLGAIKLGESKIDGSVLSTQIVVEPTPELAAHLAVSQFELRVDGQKLLTSPLASRQLTLTTRCPGPTVTGCGSTPVVAAGNHRIELVATVAGTDVTVTAPPLDLAFSCSVGQAKPPSELTANERDQVADEASGASGAEGADGADAQGCSAAPAGTRAGSTAAVALGLTLVALRTLRRSRR